MPRTTFTIRKDATVKVLINHAIRYSRPQRVIGLTMLRSTRRLIFYFLIGMVTAPIFSNAERWQPDKPTKSTAKVPSEAVEEEMVNLDALNKVPSPIDPSSGGGAPLSGALPHFKALFDLLLTVRPSIQELSFDNFHTILLFEYVPKPQLQFSFEVRPDPRYFELDYDLSNRFQLRLGRIWIPFDDMNPHNYFGGFVQTTRLTRTEPNTNAFLPDLWTDLGIGMKVRLADRRDVSFDAYLYTTNGFGVGGFDPLTPGTPSKNYPSFVSSTFPDNNMDKAVGMRFTGTVARTISAGASLYTCRYSNQEDESKRILLFGVDSQVRLTFGSEVRFGYLWGKVDLPSSSAQPHFLKQGVYGEFSQKVGKAKFLLRAGASQTDNRAIEPTDQVVIGGAGIYHFNTLFNLSLEHLKDIRKVEAKVNYEFSGLRFTMLF